jgi:hypothetical protein
MKFANRDMQYFNKFKVLSGRAVLLILAIAIGGACASPQAQMDSWIGKSKHDLIMSWGPPGRVDSDGAGGEVLTYGHYVNMGQTPGTVQPVLGGGATYTAPQANGYQKVRQFYVRPDGTIYAHRWSGY